MDFAFGENVDPAMSTRGVGGWSGERVDAVGGVGQL